MSAKYSSAGGTVFLGLLTFTGIRIIFLIVGIVSMFVFVRLVFK